MASLHWWNPLARLTFRKLECAMETACDEAAQPAAPSATSAPAGPTATPAAPTTEQAPMPAVLSFLWPVNFARISRPMENGHRGEDLAAPKGTPVYAAEAGTVTAAEYHISLGNYVVLDHGTNENGDDWTTEYAHMDSLIVQPGQTVAQGEQIGTVGNTGDSTGEHLHLELRCGDTLLPPSEYMQ